MVASNDRRVGYMAKLGSRSAIVAGILQRVLGMEMASF